MNNRKRGDYFERQTRADLEKRGWVVVRSGGSLGPADLVALHHNRPPLFIQCKINGRINGPESEQLNKVSAMAGCLPIVAWRKAPGVVGYRQIIGPGMATP